MNKNQLIHLVAKKTKLKKKDLEKMLEASLSIIVESVSKGQDVTLSGFGTFTTMKRKARKAYNPHTGAEIKVPELHLPKFRAGKDFKDSVADVKSSVLVS